MTTYTLGEIAARLGGRVRGDSGRRIAGIKPLDAAGPEDLSFVTHPRYHRVAIGSQAAGLIVGTKDRLPDHNLIVVENPYAALAAAMGIFFPEEHHPEGISAQAFLAEDVAIGKGISIGPYVVVGRRCVLGDECVLMPGVVLGDDVSVGRGTILHPGVVIYARTVIGERTVVHAGSVIGSDGFGYAESEGSRTKIPQVGNVVVGDEVEIGACVTIDRATFGSTVIGSGSKIDNLVQVAHNVVLGDGAILVAQSGIAGSTRLGNGVILAGQSGVSGHLKLGPGSVVGAKSAVFQDLSDGSYVVGIPAIEHREWKRNQVAARRLPDLLKRVARIEKSLAQGAGPSAGDAGKRRRTRPGVPHRKKRPARR